MFARSCVAFLVTAASLLSGRPADAQQRPLLTEDPEVIGAGRVLLEAGVEAARAAQYPLSGLEGSLVRVPTIGVSIGVGSIVEFQVDGGVFTRLTINERHAGPLSGLLTFTGDTTHDVEDTVVATKVRIVSESPSRPSFALRLATRLPNARNESGLGLDTFDVLATVLAGKTSGSIRGVVNLGVGVLGDPLHGYHQQTAFLYGVSVAHAVSARTEFAVDLNGRYSPGDAPPPGTETRGRLMFGARYSRGSVRFDGGVFVGLTTVDPSIGVTGGVTWVFHAFTVP